MWVEMLTASVMFFFQAVTLALTVAALAAVALAALVLPRLYRSIEAVPPGAGVTVEAGSSDACALFRFLPALRGRVAWVALAAPGNSAVHRLHVVDPATERALCVLLKREDTRGTIYKGNKVRTLEFQLACAHEQQRRRGGGARVASLGGPGSNQVVASGTYAYALGVPFRALPALPEAPSLDNALNVASMVSLPGFEGPTWVQGGVARLMAYLVRELVLPGGRDLVQNGGGNNPVGALGHVAAVLELCEQARAGDELAATPQHIFLALGSGCTTAGILAGIAVARRLGLGFEGPFSLHATPINPVAAALPWAVRWVVAKVSRDTVRLIHELGGPDASKQLEPLLASSLQLHGGLAGKYGGWTDASLAAKAVVAAARLEPPGAPKPWIDSCFTGKAFAAMLAWHRGRELESHAEERVMFWCTKSLVQPLGPLGTEETWTELAAFPSAGKDWLREGQLPDAGRFLRLAGRFSALPRPPKDAANG